MYMCVCALCGNIANKFNVLYSTCTLNLFGSFIFVMSFPKPSSVIDCSDDEDTAVGNNSIDEVTLHTAASPWLTSQVGLACLIRH